MYHKIIFNKYLNSIWLNLNQKFFYHSKNGVFGYLPKTNITETIPSHKIQNRIENSNLFRWVEAYRKHGHRKACVNSVYVGKPKSSIAELEHSRYGLDLLQKFSLNGILSNSTQEKKTIKEIQNLLEKIYCSNLMSAEFSFIEPEYEREWIIEKYENLSHSKISTNTKKEIVELLLQSQIFDQFLAIKFPTFKRYGIEGAESIFAFLREMFVLSAEGDIKDIVFCMTHRGKLNVHTIMLQTPLAKIFQMLNGSPEFPSDAKAMCDCPSNLNASFNVNYNEKQVHVHMLHTPSHLEAINPVSMGKTRSKQMSAKEKYYSNDKLKADDKSSVINIQIHGDGALPGQGVNQECLMMSGTPNFDIGGTIHIVINNQVGFTTPGERGRSTNYCTDLAKSINAPIFHVNADDPEALTLITKLAFEYQRKFQKDAFIDLNCFRRWGHNELDDPSFTNPLLYNIIHNRKSIPDLYTEKLVEENIIDKTFIENITNKHKNILNEALKNSDIYEPEKTYFQGKWKNIQQASSLNTVWDTGLELDLFNYIGKCSIYCPDDFNVHPRLLKNHIQARLKRLEHGKNLDWATAEALAIGSLMYQGNNVRISGQDVGRGTFSNRHVMLVDQKTNEMFIPLNSMEGGAGGKLEVANSILSEEAVLGFEYGMAIDNPSNLIIWEAQFGDFCNGAQIIIDTFIVNGETKWMLCNGLVILLPHGFDGAGSEHSSCKIERFLQMTDSKETAADGDDVNMNIINPTTSAQYFHALRRQILRNYRKPLIVVAPKTLLRLSEASSCHSDIQSGTSFLPVIGDTITDKSQVKKIILCSGKHYYTLDNERKKQSIQNIGIIRLESLCPFPTQELQEELKKYKNAKEFIWSQEEHRNMGAWSFIKPRFENLIQKKITYNGRPEAATTAVGVSTWHLAEIKNILDTVF